MRGPTIVRVALVDVDSHSEVGRTELPADQLPDDLSPGQSVFIGDIEWKIAGARPLSVTEAIASGQLTLELRRPPVALAPDRILFSLPTFADPHPPTDGAASSQGRLELHEDDWRQIEFVARESIDLVEAELAQIRRVYTEYARRDDSGHVVGFSSLHVRTQPTHPLGSGISVAAIRAMLPEGGQPYAGFGFRDVPGLVVDGFAIGYGPIDLYGTADVLALSAMPEGGTALAPALVNLMQTLGLVLVDWCRVQIVQPDASAQV